MLKCPFKLCRLFLGLGFAAVVSLRSTYAGNGTTGAGTGEKSAAERAIEKRQEIQLMSFFLKDPKDAATPQTPFAVTLYNQAVQYFQSNDYDLARQSLKDSISYDDKNPFAYELLGDVDYLQQRLSDAKSGYEIAYALAPTEELKKKIEKVRDESRVEKKLSTYREQHFIIKYHNEDQSVEGFELRELLRGSYRDISKEFGYYFNHQVVVLLYDEDEFKQITDVPHWVGGLYDGKVRMPTSGKGFKEKELQALTTHEVTHAFIAAMSNRMAPAWINEGLAEYMENKVQKSDLIVFRSALKTDTLLPVDLLMSQSSSLSLNDPLMISLFYEESHQLVEYLVKRYGMFRVKQILQEFGKGKNSEEALREVLHISAKRLESEWKDTFSK